MDTSWAEYVKSFEDEVCCGCCHRRNDLYEEGRLFNEALMNSADQDKISSAVSEQIALLGSKKMYERINQNFRKGRFEALFAKVKLT